LPRFVYRLKKVYELRERKKKEQEQRVIDAQNRLREIQQEIEAKREEIRTQRHDMMTAHHTMMTFYDNYLYQLNKDLEILYQKLEQAKERVDYEKKLLLKAQADMEALIKHREMAMEEWVEEEKRIEMRMLDEVAGQRYFRNQQAMNEEIALDALLAEEEEET
jgi:flagellar protein FliJ